MKKISVSVSYDEEKLSTLRLYLEQKGMQVENTCSVFFQEKML